MKRIFTFNITVAGSGMEVHKVRASNFNNAIEFLYEKIGPDSYNDIIDMHVTSVREDFIPDQDIVIGEAE